MTAAATRAMPGDQGDLAHLPERIGIGCSGIPGDGGCQERTPAAGSLGKTAPRPMSLPYHSANTVARRQ